MHGERGSFGVSSWPERFCQQRKRGFWGPWPSVAGAGRGSAGVRAVCSEVRMPQLLETLAWVGGGGSGAGVQALCSVVLVPELLDAWLGLTMMK